MEFESRICAICCRDWPFLKSQPHRAFNVFRISVFNTKRCSPLPNTVSKQQRVATSQWRGSFFKVFFSLLDHMDGNDWEHQDEVLVKPFLGTNLPWETFGVKGSPGLMTMFV